LRESALKSAVADYLEIGRSRGKWHSDRLNSGKLIASYKGGQRAINLCRPGTADFFVIQNANRNDVPFAYSFKSVRLVFLELKSDTGKQRPEQIQFEADVTFQGAEYYVLRSIEELQEVLPL